MLGRSVILVFGFLILIASISYSANTLVQVPDSSTAPMNQTNFTEATFTVANVKPPSISDTAGCYTNLSQAGEGKNCRAMGTAAQDIGFNTTFPTISSGFIQSAKIEARGNSTLAAANERCSLALWNWSNSKYMFVNRTTAACGNTIETYLLYNINGSANITSFFQNGELGGRLQMLYYLNGTAIDHLGADNMNITIQYIPYSKLNVTFITPAFPLTVQKDSTFNITVNVTCDMGDSLQTDGSGCGAVNATIFWNMTSNTNPDTELNGTIGDKPLYNFSSQVNYSCGTMASNSQCLASWLVNASGYTGQDININVTARSFNGANTSANFTSGGVATVQIRDTIPPNVTNNTPYINSVYGIDNGSININITVTDIGIGNVSNATFWFSNWSSGNATPWIKMNNVSSGDWTFWNKSFNWSQWGPTLYQGTYNITFNVTDGSGNVNVTKNVSIRLVGKPLWQNFGANATNVTKGRDMNLFAQFKDYLNLTACYLATNETGGGTWRNFSTEVYVVKDYVDEASGGGDDVAKWNNTNILSRPDTGEGTAFTTSEYGNISSQNTIYFNITATGASYAVQKFSFLINQTKDGQLLNKTSINSLNISWYGVAGTSGTAAIYYYDNVFGTWSLLTAITASQNNQIINYTVAQNRIWRFINDSGYVNIKVYSADTSSSYVATDYVKLQYSYGKYYFSPKHGNYSQNTYYNESFVWNNGTVADGSTIGFIIGCNDSMGNWNQTGVSTFFVEIVPSLNTAPDLTVPSIIPSSPLANGTLNCSTTPTDNENTTTPLYVNFTWYRNDAISDTYNYLQSCTSGNICYTGTLVPSTTLTAGDVWKCNVQAWDDVPPKGLNSTWRNSSATIQNITTQNLILFDNPDPVGTGQQAKFQSNYTEGNASPITGTNVCDIDFYIDGAWVGANWMTYNSTSLTHEYNRSFSIAEVVNWSSRCIKQNYQPQSNQTNITVQLTGGTLNVTLITPAAGSSMNVSQNSTFLVNASVVCLGGTCSNTNASVWYNLTGGDLPNTKLNLTSTDKPFSNFSGSRNQLRSGNVTQLCGTLSANQQCNVTWYVNATGAGGSNWYLNVTFNSSNSLQNSTATFQKNISVIPNFPPKWTNQSQNTSSPTVGDAVNLAAQGYDDFALNWATLSTNESGNWLNLTGLLPAGNKSLMSGTEGSGSTEVGSQRKTARNSTGAIHAVYEGGFAPRVWFSRFSVNNGSSWSTEKQVNSPPTTSCTTATLLVNTSNSLILLCGGPSTDTIMISRDNGISWTTGATGLGLYPSAFLAPNSDYEANKERILITSYDVSQNGIVFQESTTGGASLSSGILLGPNAGSINYSAMVMNSSGTIFAVWINFSGMAIGYDLVYRTCDNSSNDCSVLGSWSTQSKITQLATVNNFSMVITNDNIIHIVYEDSSGGDKEIMYTNIVTGGLVSSTTDVSSNHSYDDISPTLTTNGSTLYAIWSRNTVNSSLFYSFSTSGGGGAWSTPVNETPTFFNSTAPSAVYKVNASRDKWADYEFIEQQTDGSYNITYGQIYAGPSLTNLYGSPMYMGDVGDTWTWSNFTWQNSSFGNGTNVCWRTWYNDTIALYNVTDVLCFTLGGGAGPGPTNASLCDTYINATAETFTNYSDYNITIKSPFGEELLIDQYRICWA